MLTSVIFLLPWDSIITNEWTYKNEWEETLCQYWPNASEQLAEMVQSVGNSPTGCQSAGVLQHFSAWLKWWLDESQQFKV